jgi:tetratricopeptide (TPR) repeat protein
VSLDPESILRPLREREDDRAALRRGEAHPARVVRLAHGVEASLRRLLRDDPTAPVELRLRALAPDDLSTEALLAELGRRNRIPVELAGAFHALHGAVAGIEAGAEATPADAALAAEVADALEAHVRVLPQRAPLRDPVAERARPHGDGGTVHPVPASARRVPWAALLAFVAIVALLVVAIRLRGDDDRVRQGEVAYREGRVVEAERSFREAVEDAPSDPLPRIYLARIYLEAGRPGDAEREVAAGLERAPASAGLHVERGYLLLDTSRPGEAVDAFREALRHDRESRRAWAGLVRALRAAGRSGDAEEVLRMAPPDLRALMRTADERAPVPR